MNSTKDQRPNYLTIKILSLILASDDAEICEIPAAEGKNTFHVNIVPNNFSCMSSQQVDCEGWGSSP